MPAPNLQSGPFAKCSPRLGTSSTDIISERSFLPKAEFQVSRNMERDPRAGRLRLPQMCKGVYKGGHDHSSNSWNQFSIQCDMGTMMLAFVFVRIVGKKELVLVLQLGGSTICFVNSDPAFARLCMLPRFTQASRQKPCPGLFSTVMLYCGWTASCDSW